MNRILHPASPYEVTPDWLSQVLHSSGVLGNGSVSAVDVEIVGEDRGFTGVVARLALHYDGGAGDRPGGLVAKFPLAERDGASSYRLAQAATPQRARQFAERCAREVEFFQLVEGDPPQIPECYFTYADVDAGEVILLLEDLSVGEAGDALAGCSIEEARSVLNGIGDIHAAWWNGASLSSLGWLPAWAASNAGRVDRFRNRVEPLVDRYLDRFSGDIVELLRVSAAHYDRVLADLVAAPATLIHLDLHLDNVIFMPSGGVPNARIIDWQSVHGGPAMLDVAGFIAEALEVEVRRASEVDLLHEYHEGLLTAGVDDYGFEQLFDDYLRALLVRLAGNAGWLARVEMDELEGRERELVEAIFEPGRVFQALLDHEAGRRFGLG